MANDRKLAVKDQMVLSAKQADALRTLLIIAGVSNEQIVSIQALNAEYVSRNPVGPHNSESVRQWIDNEMDRCRKLLVPLFWKKDGIDTAAP